MAIAEVDPEGKFIQLINRSKKEVSLLGWQLVHKALHIETIHKFNRPLKVAPGGNVLIWSADSGASHEPPSNVVLEQKWFVDGNPLTQLLNNNGEVIDEYRLGPKDSLLLFFNSVRILYWE